MSNNNNQTHEISGISKTGTTTLASSSALASENAMVKLEDPATTGVSGRMQDISNFLQKPMLISAPTFSTTSIRNAIITQVDIGSALKSYSVWVDKMAGAANVRGTAVITVQSNASPYNAGGLLLHFIPNYSNAVNFHSGRSTLISRSQQPNIKMDVATTKEVVLKIPYTSPTKYYNLVSNTYDWGRVYLTVYSPLTSGSGAPTTVPISMWLHFEDFECETAIYAQTGVRKGQRGSIKPFNATPSEQELPPVSRVLRSVSVIASTIAGIPSLTPLAGPVAWFTNVASGVASSFGWSKPLDDNNGGRMQMGPHFGAQNCNGKDLSQQLSLFADNKVRVMSELGRDNVDETSIGFLLSIPTYFSNYQLNTTQNSGDIVCVIPIRPNQFSETRTLTVAPATAQVTSHSPISLMSTLFRVYRGSISIIFHMYKTQFHSGRFIVSFVPGFNTIPPTLAQTNYLHRAIIDMSEGNEFCLIFPYTSITDYLDTNQLIGTAYVHVLNPIRSPDSVSTSIDVVLEVVGGPDLEFQMPTSEGITPIVAQSGADNGEDTNEANNLICENIGGSTVPSDIQGASQYTIGEQVTTLAQLAKRYMRCLVNGQFFTPGSGVSRFNPYSIDPTVLPSTGRLAPVVGGDYISFLSSMYIYSRGGMRIRVMNSYSDSVWRVWLDTNTYPTTFNNISGEDTASTKQARVSAFSTPCRHGGFSVQIPFYNKTYARLNRYYAPTDTIVAPDNPQVSVAIALLGQSTGPPTNVIFTRAVADDFQLIYFIGIPDMVVYN